MFCHNIIHPSIRPRIVTQHIDNDRTVSSDDLKDTRIRSYAESSSLHDIISETMSLSLPIKYSIKQRVIASREDGACITISGVFESLDRLESID